MKQVVRQDKQMALDDQNTEALLAAYIDGELDHEQRVAVEASLAKRPHHARMVDEMRRARALVTGLPRELAPAGLSDEVVGQLERSALLDPAGLAVKNTGHRPLALAAGVVLLLAGGLIAFVLFGLPEVNNPVKVAANNAKVDGLGADDIDPDVIDVEPTPEGVGGPTTPTVPGGDKPLPDDDVDTDEPATFTRDMFAGDAPILLGGGKMPPGLVINLSDHTPPNPLDIRPGQPADIDDAVMVIAETDDPATLRGELQRFAAEHQLVPEPAADGTIAVRMKRRDAVLLADALTSAWRVTLLNAEASAGGVIEPGETLRVELIRPDNPERAEAVDVTVDDDGNVRLAGEFVLDVEPLPAAGATEAELAAALEAELGSEER
ncbi:MAG: hypothetical protein AAF743_06835, partial [Planctomycetota bacterium]